MSIGTARKAGWQPPAWLLERLARVHPRVRLLWSCGARTWCLYERCMDGSWEMICRIDGLPTYANTVLALNECHPSRFEDSEAFDEFLAEIDEPQRKDEEAVLDASEALTDEGSDRMFDQLSTRHHVSIPRRKTPD